MKINKKILFLILLAAVLPSLAFAQVTLASMAEAAMHAIVDAVGFLVVILWIYTGVLFLTAQGDPGKLSAAKIALFSAIAGTIIVIIANFATDFVGKIFNI